MINMNSNVNRPTLFLHFGILKQNDNWTGRIDPILVELDELGGIHLPKSNVYGVIATKSVRMYNILLKIRN